MDPKQLDAIERWNCLLAAILIVGASVLFDLRVALGVASGALLSCANFYGIHKLLERSMRAHGGRRLLLQSLLMGKMLVLMVLVFLALKYVPLSPVGLAVGLSVFLLSIAAETIRFALGDRVNDGRA